MAVAYLQEFEIQGGDTSTTNYDALNSALNLQEAPDGLLIHTAGFDHDAGVFRIFDVWETREHGEKFMSEKLTPIIERMAAEAAERGRDLHTADSPGLVRPARLDDRLTRRSLPRLDREPDAGRWPPPESAGLRARDSDWRGIYGLTEPTDGRCSDRVEDEYGDGDEYDSGHRGEFGNPVTAADQHVHEPHPHSGELAESVEVHVENVLRQDRLD